MMVGLYIPSNSVYQEYIRMHLLQIAFSHTSIIVSTSVWHFSWPCMLAGSALIYRGTISADRDTVVRPSIYIFCTFCLSVTWRTCTWLCIPEESTLSHFQANFATIHNFCSKANKCTMDSGWSNQIKISNMQSVTKGGWIKSFLLLAQGVLHTKCRFTSPPPRWP